MGKFDSLIKKEKKGTISIPVSKEVAEELKGMGEALKVTQNELKSQIFQVGLAELRKELSGADSHVRKPVDQKRTAQ